MRSMVEGCPAIERVTPLRQAFGQPPPLPGEEWCKHGIGHGHAAPATLDGPA